ncbi:Histidine kinase [Pedobacter xixiisoli]|uniref:Histidine kinase n=1 Tax=Pedobacter xixiisoli TaxID=1476464 RepID=A0A286A6G3_9SPHI|nr:Histidine kinase [Pedobacter xixiisoli]
MQKKMRLQTSIQTATGILILALPLFIFFGHNSNHYFGLSQILHYIIFCFLFVGIYFLHSKILFPKLYLAKKYLIYFVVLLAQLSGIIVVRPFDRFISNPNRMEQAQPPKLSPPINIPPPPSESPRPLVDIVSIFTFLLAIIIGVTIETNKQLRLTMQRVLMAETEKAQAELAFLKAQVNPHFLFNILNNIYTLALTQDSNTASSIMKLSNMMRYLTDEAGNDEVSLSQEIACMTDYVDLQRLRLTQKTNIEYEIKGNIEDKKIAPLILMAFVENVFKYGVSNHKNNKLIIKLLAEHNLINLYCENTINPDKKNEKRTGIGLENTKKRLQYIYPNKHILAVENDQKVFKINLSIHLN